MRPVFRKWLVNSSRHYLRAYNEEFAQAAQPGARVLDAGAGTQPYRPLFEHCVYETADFEQVDKAYAPSTYVCDLAKIPVEDARFDHVVFNQVLEHIPEPKTVLRELNRVLKPGGTIICTCPLFYAEHEQPYDFYRYTQFAHRYLFDQTGFEIRRLEWMEGYFGTLGYQLGEAALKLPLHPRRYAGHWAGLAAYPLVVVTKLACFVMAGLFYRLDRVIKVTDRGMPKNYVVIAVKT